MRIKLDLPFNETLIGKPEISSVTSFSLGDGTMRVLTGDIRRDELGFIQGTSITGGAAFSQQQLCSVCSDIESRFILRQS